MSGIIRQNLALAQELLNESLPVRQFYAETLPSLVELEKEYRQMQKEMATAAAGKDPYAPRLASISVDANRALANRLSLVRAREAYRRKKARDAARHRKPPASFLVYPAKKERA